MKHKRRYLSVALLAVGALSLLVYWVMVDTYRIEVVRHDMRATVDAEPLRIVQVSDLHLRSFGRREMELAQQIKDLEADVIVLSGDAIDKVEALPLLRSFVKGLAPVPVLLVPGNWEHWSGLDFVDLQNTLSTTGATLLLNDRWSLSRGDRSLQIIGLDDFTAGQPDLRLLEANNTTGTGALTVLVQHSPAFFDQPNVTKQMVKQRFSLCLAGHTHGGQLALGGWAPYTPVGSGRFVAGFYDVPGCRLFVSLGVGTSVLPIRFGAPAEVVVFDL